MLDPKEVRVGNWVIKVTGKDARDTAYLEYRAVAIDEYFFTWAKFCFPIKVTPAILFICGFVQEAGEWKLPLIRTGPTGENLHLRWNAAEGWCLNHLKLPSGPVYLHQLQNLCYALNGKELEVKLLPYQNENLLEPIRFNQALLRKE